MPTSRAGLFQLGRKELINGCKASILLRPLVDHAAGGAVMLTADEGPPPMNRAVPPHKSGGFPLKGNPQ